MDEVIWQETLRLAKGTVVLDLAVLAATALMGIPPKPMALGLLFGSLYLLLHFQLIGISVKRTLSGMAPENARRRMTASVWLRYLLTGVVLWVGARSPSLHLLGVALPLFYPKLLYYGGAVAGQLRRRKEETPKGGRT